MLANYIGEALRSGLECNLNDIRSCHSLRQAGRQAGSHSSLGLEQLDKPLAPLVSCFQVPSDTILGGVVSSSHFCFIINQGMEVISLRRI